MSATEINDTILVYEDNGIVKHCFCTQAHALEALRFADENCSSAYSFRTEGHSIELLYSVSDIRERVEEAKSKFRRDIIIRDVLDRNGVPKDKALRAPIYKSISELQLSLLRAVF